MVKPTESYNIGAKSGVLEGKHIRAMGIAGWLFFWCLRRQTDKLGWVLGGKVITSLFIAQDMDMPRRTIERWLSKLVSTGYIEVHEVAGLGIRIRVINQKKFRIQDFEDDEADDEQNDGSDSDDEDAPPPEVADVGVTTARSGGPSQDTTARSGGGYTKSGGGGPPEVADVIIIQETYKTHSEAQHARAHEAEESSETVIPELDATRFLAACETKGIRHQAEVHVMRWLGDTKVKPKLKPYLDAPDSELEAFAEHIKTTTMRNSATVFKDLELLKAKMADRQPTNDWSGELPPEIEAEEQREHERVMKILEAAIQEREEAERDVR